MKLFSLSLFSILLLGTSAFAQHDARYSQYMFNQLLLNPGYAGSTEALSFDIFYRDQWRQLDGAPQTYSISLHSPMGDNIGLGGFLEYDVIGLHTSARGNLAFSYRLPLGRGHLNIGVQGGVSNYQITYSKANLEEQGDFAFADDVNKWLPNVGTGIYYHTENFYAGLSVPHLLNNEYRDKVGVVTRIAHEDRHYFATIGGVIPINEYLKVVPSALFKSVPMAAPYQVDLNVNLHILNTLWLGASYRTDDQYTPESVLGIVGVHLKNGLRVGYAYDYTLNDLGEYTGGTHELTLGFDFARDKVEKIITPRFF